MSVLRRRPVALGCLAGLSLGAVAAALVTQHGFDMQPCPWCVLQRLIFVGIAGVALLDLAWRNAAGQMFTAVLLLGLSLCGVAAALWQHFVAAASSSCNLTLAERIIAALRLDAVLPEIFQARASCADAAVKLWGLPYEFWSLALFMLMAVWALRLLLNPSR